MLMSVFTLNCIVKHMHPFAVYLRVFMDKDHCDAAFDDVELEATEVTCGSEYAVGRHRGTGEPTNTSDRRERMFRDRLNTKLTTQDGL